MERSRRWKGRKRLPWGRWRWWGMLNTVGRALTSACTRRGYAAVSGGAVRFGAELWGGGMSSRRRRAGDACR